MMLFWGDEQLVSDIHWPNTCKIINTSTTSTLHKNLTWRQCLLAEKSLQYTIQETWEVMKQYNNM